MLWGVGTGVDFPESSIGDAKVIQNTEHHTVVFPYETLFLSILPLLFLYFVFVKLSKHFFKQLLTERS